VKAFSTWCFPVICFYDNTMVFFLFCNCWFILYFEVQSYYASCFVLLLNIFEQKYFALVIL
jgi:hypothetical protein